MIEFIQNLSIHGVAIWPLVQAVLTFIGGAAVLGSAIAPLTKTDADDKFWNKVHSVLEKISLATVVKKDK